MIGTLNQRILVTNIEEISPRMLMVRFRICLVNCGSHSSSIDAGFHTEKGVQLVRLAIAAYFNQRDQGSVADEEMEELEWLRAGKNGIEGVLSNGLGGVFPPLKLNRFFDAWEVESSQPEP